MAKNDNIFFRACMALALTGTIQAHAQADSYYDNRLLGECRSLFAAGSYGQAGILLGRMPYGQGLASAEEIDYMKTVIAAKKDIAAAKPLLESFLQNNGKSVYTDRVLALYGEACVATRDFDRAIASFEACNMKYLSESEKGRAGLNYAIALFRCGRTGEAALQLDVCSENCPDDMKDELLFYRAYSDYQSGRYEEAGRVLPLFLDSRHQAEARLYLAQMAMENNQQAAFDVLDVKGLSEIEEDSAVSLEALRLLGENSLKNGDSRAAADIFLEYIDRAGDMAQLQDRYLAGLALYDIRQWDAVIDCLAPVSEGTGEMAQSAALYMGLAALKNGDGQMARMSFQRSWQIPGSDEVREQALYNYSMLLHESQTSLFDDAVQAMETFLNDYPNSEYAGNVTRCLAQEYAITSNYDAALASISRIRKPGREILNSKQKLLTDKAMDEFAAGNYGKSASLLTDAEQIGRFETDRTRELLFWRAESYYRAGLTDKAGRDWNRCLALRSSKDRITAMAHYGLGYLAFNRRSYYEAANEMRQSLAVRNGLDNQFAADATLRLADCQLNLKQYSNALDTYWKVLSMNSNRNDYVLSRCAAVNGLMRQYYEKIACLERLVREYPESQYVPQALFDMGTTYQQTGFPNYSIVVFQRIVESYPTLDLARRAAVETALAYYRMDDYDNAIRMYRKVIENYPGSAEARTALADLRSIYVENGDVASFIAYTQTIGGDAVLASDQKDSLSYAAAESKYRKGQTAQALNLFTDYLDRYPNGAYKTDARYYSAVIYEKNGDYDNAIDNYLEAAAAGNSRFATDALSKAAAMAYSSGDWETSLDLYIRLYGKASEPGLRETCAVRIVLSAGKIGEHDAVIEYYDAAVKGRKDSQLLSDIRYCKAKALMAKSDGGEELYSLLEELSQDTRSQNGAECDYLLSQLLYDRGNAAKAQDNIMELMGQGTPHLYWLSRSLILLSDILKDQGKDTEARQYLISLQANYTGQDDIAGMIEERLNK